MVFARSDKTLLNAAAAKSRAAKFWAVIAFFTLFFLLLNSILNQGIVNHHSGNLTLYSSEVAEAWDETQDVFRIDRKNIGASIFFLETSGRSCLSRRQACSVESAARTNPDYPVRVFFVKDRPKGLPAASDSATGKTELGDCNATSALLAFPNVALHNETFATLVNGTSLKDWLQRGSMNTSNYPTAHTSDAVRIALLKKYGGAYLDLDCIVLRSIKELRNLFALNGYGYTENGVLIFDANHPFLSFYEDLFVKHFYSAGYDTNGPRLLNTVFQRYCNITVIFPHKYDCQNSTLSIYHQDNFFLIDWNHRDWFYVPTYPKYLDQVVKSKFISHIYDNDDRKAPPGCLYATLAEEFCPDTFKRSMEVAGMF